MSKPKITIPTLRELLEAGVHFGHQSRRWHPGMAPYIFAKRKGIHIFDLEITQKKLEEASQALYELACSGTPIIFVCTKRQVRQMVVDGATEAGVMYVTNRWLGGTLTNFSTLQKSLKKYNDLVAGLEEGSFSSFTKKERSMMMRQKVRLDKLYGGIKDLKGLPGALVIIDSKRERTAVREANIVGVPVIALADSNCDPVGIDHLVPGNDDAFRSVQLILKVFFEAVRLGKAQGKKSDLGEQKTEVRKEGREEKHSPKEEENVVEEVIEKVEKGLEALGLSNRSFNALSKAGVKSLEDLKKLAEEELESIKGLGKKSLDEIRGKIK